MSKLRDARRKARLTQAQVAEAANVTQGQIVKLEKGIRKLTKEWAEILAPILGVRAVDLMFDDVPLVRSFDPDQPEPLSAEDGELQFPPDAIRELASRAGLGSGQVIETTYRREGSDHVAQDALTDDFWRIPPRFIRDRLQARVTSLLILNCEGDSMAPTINPNEAVLVNTAHRLPSPDGLYAIRDRFEQVIVKRLQVGANDRIHVLSDNPSHMPMEFGLDEIAIIGRVVMVMKLT